MHVITKKRITEFGAAYPGCQNALDRWYTILDKTNYKNFGELRKTFPTADKVGKYIVFNVGGNKVRIITAIHFNTNMVFIRSVLSHKDYDKNKWKD